MLKDPLPKLEIPAGLTMNRASMLKNALVRSLSEDDTDWGSESPEMRPESIRLLGTAGIELLAEAGAVTIGAGAISWNFRPFFGNGLLLFRDLEIRRFHREFVWLHTEVDSGSWRLPDSVRILPGMQVLDLGCGSGLNALRCAARGAQSIGIDINPRAAQVANFNRAINALDTARFYHCDWNEFPPTDYDLVISQPPFDPELPGGNEAYAFGGGGDDGLEYSIDLIQRFQPARAYQSMQLYVHSFVENGVTVLDSVLSEILPREIGHTMIVRKSYPIAVWWSKYRDRHDLGADYPLPKMWKRFEAVHACFFSIAPKLGVRRAAA